MLMCSYLDIFQNHFLYVMYILFCCVYSVYNGQMSPNFATSNLQMLKRLPVYDKVVKLAHFIHFVLTFIGKVVLTLGQEFVPPVNITYACICPCPLDWWWRKGSKGGNSSSDQNGHIQKIPQIITIVTCVQFYLTVLCT